MIPVPAIKQTMKAIGLHKYLPIDHPDSLIDVEIEKPQPSGRDLLVQVKAISVNPVDTKVRSPKENVEEAPRILGWDVAGIVEETGSECSLFQPGDEVYYAGSIIRPGGNSEFHLIDERIVGHKPATLSFAESAALPLTTITAWEALYDRLGISRHPDGNENKTILIIGAAGGVGSIAIQLAGMAGLNIIATASRPETIEWVKELGADYVINHHEAFLPQLKKRGFEHVDYIFCLNSTFQHWSNMAEAIAPQGKICSIVGMGEPVNLQLLNSKSVTFVWELMFTRSMYQTDDMEEQHKLLDRVAKMVDAGKIRTTLTECIEPINAKNLRIAHQKIESGLTIGKIVLQNFPE
jgi:zinc-binding alcohol dehydrogenase family protein